MSVETEEQLRTYITQQLLTNQQAIQIGSEDNLLLNGMIDSLGVMQLVKFIEDSFDIDVGPGEITLKNFKTISTMSNFISNKSAVKNETHAK